MSGFATAGLAVVNDLDHLPEGVNVWRHLMQYVGGQGLVLVLRRGGRAWVQLNDDAYATQGPLSEHHIPLGGNSGLAVSIDDTTAARIRSTGGYDAQGDRLRVVGPFHEADPADGGAPTIRARETTIAERGHPVLHPVPRRLILGAIVAAATAITLVVVVRPRSDDTET